MYFYYYAQQFYVISPRVNHFPACQLKSTTEHLVHVIFNTLSNFQLSCTSDRIPDSREEEALRKAQLPI